MPSNSIVFARNYTSMIDEVYQRASVSGVLNSGRRMVRAGHNAKEILIPKISVTGLGNYTRNVGYRTGAITYEFETKTFNYDRGIRLFADVMDVEEAGVNDCFVEAGAELQRTQVAPEADAFTFAQIAGHTSVTGWANLSNVTSMRYAMNGCTGVTSLDLRGMDPSSLTDLFYAFAGCSALTTIYADSTWALPGTASGSGTFYNCRSIVGGNGTAYSTSAYGYARMVIDRAGQTGYLTAA